ncbi:hypothetical protein BJD55_gp165 [Gordonia phage Yvonnetastic]|uniref:Minor tail protein n=1 Tax=Gordonia phage Yvonnetastic TaxID=1821566 RepID=A0A142K918_9CAUD|nr:hypothetical protein BJD55_gp165 [Gordonia phage Yvonnetastic]AMS02601.1 hypothetical protein SEA_YVONNETASTIC_57 [Gordonia phage Yvonnetastic]WKW86033.1 hypothetical protein SEA_JONJAMES_59 [Gordonia Phage JonJames]
MPDVEYRGPGSSSSSVVKRSYVDGKIEPYDMTIVAFGKDTTRATGTGDNPFGIRLRRAVQLKAVHYRCNTASGSGTLSVELRQNGVAIAGTAAAIAVANQVTGATVSGLSVNLAAGDILTVQITAVGGTPGKGLVADIEAVAI